MFGNGTGIDDVQVSTAGRLHLFIALLHQFAGNGGTLGIIELASERNKRKRLFFIHTVNPSWSK